MNTRKANLKKLRLPSTQANGSRNLRRRATSTISHFFTPEIDVPDELENEENKKRPEPMPSPIEYPSPLPALDTTPPQITCSLPLPSPINKLETESENSPIRAVRTKLKTFLHKEKRLKSVADIPVTDFITTRESNDFETPAKTIKAAPKNKAKPRSKKQQTIKSAFFKNEELFSEVTAQHCLVEKINPDEMQMALALSISEAESARIPEEGRNKDDRETIRDKLKNFGFQVAESEDYGLTTFMKKRGKSKWANKFTPLTLRNPKRQLDKVNQKVEEILRTQFSQSESLHSEELWTVSVHSNVLLPLVADSKIVQSDSTGRLDVVDFYVLSLFEPSKTKVGYLLKDVHRIPGRDRSPSKSDVCSKPKYINPDVDDLQVQSPSIKKTRVDKDDAPVDAFSCPIIELHDEENKQIHPLTKDNIPEKQPAAARRRKIPLPRTADVECSEIVKLGSIENLNSLESSQEVRLELIETNIGISQLSMNDMKMHETPAKCSINAISTQLLLKPLRATSPDIFADSDVEMEIDNEMEQLKFSSSSGNIETFELFSSDEVKTCSETNGNTCPQSDDLLKAVIDLTQQGSDTNSEKFEALIPSIPIQSYQEPEEMPLTSFYRLDDDCPSTSVTSRTEDRSSVGLKNFKEAEFSFIYNTSQHLEKSKRNSCFSFGSSASEEVQKSKTETNSIDLTQNSCCENDDECIVLSDDEVNYSIRKIERSLHVKKEASLIYESPKSDSKEAREFSFVDFVASTQPLEFPSDEFETEFVNKSNLSIDSIEMDLSKRSDFGILDEQSPFKTPTKTPIKTPRKTPRKTPTKTSPSATTTKCRRTLSESFLGSPMESSAPVKRFSSSNKFQEFTKSEDEDSFSALDDIDKLIYGSPSKKVYKKPIGLTQLLTGAITTKIVSPVKTQEVEEELPQEFDFNGRTYLVRTVNVAQRPNFDTMDDSALMNQLYKYGIKPLKRKQAVKILEYVYNQTHPCLVDETDFVPPTVNSQSDMPDVLDEDVESIENGAVSDSKFNLKDCWGHILVSETMPSFEIKDEQFIFQTNTSKKILTASLPFHIAWYNLVKSNKQLHEAILHYEPIDLQEVYLFFKGLGYRYDPKELKYFFDSRSIVFRYDLKKSDPSAGASRHVRKKRHKFTQAKIS